MRYKPSPLPSVRSPQLPASATSKRRKLHNDPLGSSLALRIGTRVRALRMAAEASGGDLALASGVSRSLLSRIEHGQVSPSLESLDRIARGLKVPLARIFEERD